MVEGRGHTVQQTHRRWGCGGGWGSYACQHCYDSQRGQWQRILCWLSEKARLLRAIDRHERGRKRERQRERVRAGSLALGAAIYYYAIYN